MQTTRIFKCGNSQAVRIPKELQFDGENVVEIFRRDGEVVLRKIPKNLGEAFKLLTNLPKDFFAGGRKDTAPQKRNFS